MSTTIFDSLPGMETPVSDVARTLASVWDMEAAPGKPAPSEFRASQMNLVVHLGLDNTVETARAAFDTALRFSHRYPCRTIVLCPRDFGGALEVRAKVFCECFVGASHHEMVCSEAIILSYPLEQRAYLENQASIMIESDLPLYYWPVRIQQASRFADYPFLLNQSQRIIVDSAVENADVPGYAWPRAELVHDLAGARILPLRQSLGHFLSYVPPAQLVNGLRSIVLHHGPDVAAEARAVAQWFKSRLVDCAAAAKVPPAACDVALEADRPAGGLGLRCVYDGGGTIDLDFDLANGASKLSADLGQARSSMSSSVRLLSDDRALAEALFF